MRRKVLARSVRGVIERLEARCLLSSTLSLGTGAAAISGVAYNDLDGSGTMDLGEPVVPGATITLAVPGVTYAAGTIPTAQADANGAFSFTHLAAGEYLLNIVPDPGFVADASSATLPDVGFIMAVGPTDSISFNIGETMSNVGGGSGVATLLTGTVFNDSGETGVYNPGVDAFLAGDTVYLDLNGNGVFDAATEPSAITNNIGVYEFSTDPFSITFNPIPAGSYPLRVVPRPGFHQDPPGFIRVTLYSDTTTTQNIGETNLATLSGIVFQDDNGNGILDPGEMGVSGETVFIDGNMNGTYDPNPILDPITLATITPADPPAVTSGADGFYTFLGLTPGNYRVIVNSNLLNNNVQDTPQYSDVSIIAGQSVTLNIGEGKAGTISGTVFNDRNANGVLDPGENGLANQTVFLDQNNNGVFNPTGGTGPDGLPAAFPEYSAVTDPDGHYTILNVGPGTYTLRLATPAGATLTAPSTNQHSYPFTLVSTQIIVNQNFGFEAPDLTVKFIKMPTAPALTDVVRHATVRVTNVGSLPFNGAFGVNLWAQTTNAPVDMTTAFLVGVLPGVGAHFGIGQSRVYKLTFAYPTQLPLNAYFVSAQVVNSGQDSNPANDFSSPVGPIQVGPPYVDIGIAYQVVPPFIIDPGQPTPISLLVTNHGNVPTKGTLDFRIYLSPDPSIDPNAKPQQDTIMPSFKLAPNQSRIVHITIPYPGQNVNFRFINVYVTSNEPLGDPNIANNTAIEAQATRFD